MASVIIDARVIVDWRTACFSVFIHSLQRGTVRGDCLLYISCGQAEAMKSILIPAWAYLGNETILVVDDIEEQRDIATRMLGRLGYHVTAVSSGEEALAYLQAHTVDLLVLDMIMDPGIDGLETYKRILEKNPRQKAIIASGYSESERVKTLQMLGVGAYVRKPYTLERIGMAVRNELNRK